MSLIACGRGIVAGWAARVGETVRAGIAVVRGGITRVRTVIDTVRAHIEDVQRTVSMYVLLMRVVAVAGRLGVRQSVNYALAAFAVTGLMLMSALAQAFTAPAAGDFGYDIYDIVVNQILNGPIGFIGGVALIVFGATKIMTNWMMTILCIIAGTILIRAADLVVTLGATI